MVWKVASLFAGCGGVDLGFRGDFTSTGVHYARLPFEVVWANDIDAKAALSYKKNLGDHIVCAPIDQVLAAPEEHSFPKEVDVLCGGFPCQAFSLAGKRLGFSDHRGILYLSMKKSIKMLQPKVFVAENVKGLLSHDEGKTFKTILKEFESLGYMISWKLVRAQEFGIAQNRERILIVGVKKSLGLPAFDHPGAPYQFKSVKDALSDLEDKGWDELPNHQWSKAAKNKGQGNTKLIASQVAPTMRAEHHGNIEFHYALERRLSAREAARIQSFPDTFVFEKSTTDAYRQIGNAVPPVLAWHLAQQIDKYLRFHLPA